jgi:tRNA threonylcarbamoyladenosine biosynthesis protein TsaE
LPGVDIISLQHRSKLMQQIFSLDQLNEAVRLFWHQYGHQRIFVFRGAMGAGKTTFIHALAQHLGVHDAVSSPTFSIINEYLTDSGDHIYHADLYRINDSQEAEDIGLDELLQSGAVFFIEWPERIASLLPSDTVWTDITTVSSGERMIKVSEAG